MTAMHSVSVIVISRDRPHLMARLNRALDQQSFQNFERIIVGNFALPGLTGAGCVPVHFDEANVSAARNAGIRASKGEIVAFCDDDAVPEPAWLERIIAPFADKGVGCAAGYVLGRNGIDLQWQPVVIDASAEETGPKLTGGVYRLPAGQAVTPVGTNCAFRRRALQDVGGFDEAFRYYLDETDANWRLSCAGWATAVVPDAVVHHSYAANASRAESRVPTSFFEIAASKAVFLRKNAGGVSEAQIDDFRQRQLARAYDAFALGLIDAAAVEKLRQTFENGFAEGMVREFGRQADLGGPTGPTGSQARRPAATVAFCGGRLHRERLFRAAREKAETGASVTVICYALTALASKVHYTKDGFWLHSGGIFGRVNRQGAVWRFRTRKARIAEEIERICDQRTFETVEFL